MKYMMIACAAMAKRLDTLLRVADIVGFKVRIGV